jgi:hypothetical protein
MEAPWTLEPRRWNDGDHAMTHKMEIKCKKDHIISHYHACDVNPFMHLILLRYDHDGSIIR